MKALFLLALLLAPTAYADCNQECQEAREAAREAREAAREAQQARDAARERCTMETGDYERC